MHHGTTDEVGEAVEGGEVGEVDEVVESANMAVGCKLTELSLGIFRGVADSEHLFLYRV